MGLMSRMGPMWPILQRRNTARHAAVTRTAKAAR